MLHFFMLIVFGYLALRILDSILADAITVTTDAVLARAEAKAKASSDQQPAKVAAREPDCTQPKGVWDATEV